MPTILQHLFSPYSLGGLQLRNRVVMAPMTRGRAGADRVPGAISAEYYAQRAAAGLVVTEATTVSEQANGWVDSPGIYTDAMAEGWKTTTEAVHRKGGTIFLQLWHCGRASHSSFHNGELAVAPSAIPTGEETIHTPKGKEQAETPRTLETAEIPGIVDDYRKATERAKEAGFDGVEIHAANGYLIDTFLQSVSNHRDDAYGGDIVKRYRFLGEVVAAVTAAMPANRVGVRVSPNGVYNGMGSPDYLQQFLYVAEMLNKVGLAYLHVIDGLGFGFHELGVPMKLEDFRKVYEGTLIGNCGYDAQSAEDRIAEGNADLIAFGRPYISNPDLVERFEHGWPLAEPAPMEDWYTPKGAAGYTDFPTYQGAK